jgi:hypothetical protein
VVRRAIRFAAARPWPGRSYSGLHRPAASPGSCSPGQTPSATEAVEWAEIARACDLPNVHAFTRGLDLDALAIIAAVTLPFHNGRTEGLNIKTKMI